MSVTTHPRPARTADPDPSALPGARDGRDPARAIKRGPSRLPAEFVAATQRDRLFDAMARTVAQEGYANATVSDICRAAGVTRPAFYVHFDSKQGAFLATYRHGTEVLFRMMEQAHEQAPDWPAATAASLRVLLEVLASAPAFATMAIVEIDAVGAEARAERERLLQRFRLLFGGAPRPSGAVAARELVDTVVGGVYHAIYRAIAARRIQDLPELLPTLTYFVLAPFLGSAAAAPSVARNGSGSGSGSETGSGSGPQRPAVAPCAPLFRAPQL